MSMMWQCHDCGTVDETAWRGPDEEPPRCPVCGDRMQ